MEMDGNEWKWIGICLFSLFDKNRRIHDSKRAPVVIHDSTGCSKLKWIIATFFLGKKSGNNDDL